MPTLFVVVPLFNEPGTLDECIDSVMKIGLPAGWRVRVVLVDDGSDNPTKAATDGVARKHLGSLTLITHSANKGKGAALRTGFEAVVATSTDECDSVAIQDADLEYDPHDLVKLLTASLSATPPLAIFGNRWHRGATAPGLRGWIHMRGNRLLTRASNIATGLRVSDMECCYKLLPIGVLRKILPHLTEQRFGIEPQIASALAAAKVAVREVPVSYKPRSWQEGKKIGPIDGLRALWVIFTARK